MKSQQKKPTLLFVITQGHWGGAQQYVQTLAEKLSDDFTIHVAIGSDPTDNDLARRLPATTTVHRLHHLRRSISPIHDAKAVRELRKLYKHIGPKIIHLNSTKAGILGGIAAQKLTKTAVVYTIHGWVFNEPIPHIKKLLYKAIEQHTSKHKDIIITLSPQDSCVGKQIVKKYTTIREIPIGLGPTTLLAKKDAQVVLEKSINKNIDTGTHWFGTIANLYKTKGYDVYLQAIANMEKRNDCVFFCIGDGPEKDQLLRIKNTLNLEHVHFIGAIENARSLLHAFDTFVLPSKKEGLPYTILEAMHAEVPVITTNVGGIPSLITHKETGLCVEPSNAKELTKALNYAKDHNDHMKSYAKTAKEVSKTHSLENMVEKTRRLYNTLL